MPSDYNHKCLLGFFVRDPDKVEHKDPLWDPCEYIFIFSLWLCISLLVCTPRNWHFQVFSFSIFPQLKRTKRAQHGINSVETHASLKQKSQKKNLLQKKEAKTGQPVLPCENHNEKTNKQRLMKTTAWQAGESSCGLQPLVMCANFSWTHRSGGGASGTKRGEKAGLHKGPKLLPRAPCFRMGRMENNAKA